MASSAHCSAVLVATTMLNLPLLIVLLVIHSIISVFHQSAFDASYAMMVPESKLSAPTA